MSYIVGRTFKSQNGQHLTGDEISDSVAETWGGLESLINSGLLYRVHSIKSYAYLPPHVFSNVKNREEILAIINGEHSLPEHTVSPSVEEEIARIKVEQEGIALAAEHALVLQEKKVAKEARKDDVSEPAEKFLPPKVEQTDTMKSVAEERGTGFDPESIRVMKLEDLREEARKREISPLGNKPEVAQRIIDDEISKATK